MNQREFIGVWRDWYAERTERKPHEIKIGSRHGKAAKEMIQYFKDAYPETDPGECLEAILKNWDRLDVWYQRNFMELWSINDHLNNIINKIKNGNGTNHDQISAYLQSL